MRIITTLLVLLLASPAFAETYVCSWVNVAGQIISDSYTRTAAGFDHSSSVTETAEWEIIHESEWLLVLHYTTSNVVVSNTEIALIFKNRNNRYAFVYLSDVLKHIQEGTCTVVE